MWKTTLDIFRMFSRENGTVYKLNKQTNCGFISTRDTQRRHCELRWCLS
jgi:hypothetical protein